MKYSLDFWMYVILIGLFLLVLRVENKDNNCSDPWKKDAVCDGFSGMPFSGNKPEPGDSCSQVLDKIHRAADSENRMIKWRRAFILAVASSLAIFLLILTPRTLPPFQILYLTTAVIWAVLYFSFNYYSYHLLSIPKEQIQAGVKQLRSSCIH